MKYHLLHTSDLFVLDLNAFVAAFWCLYLVLGVLLERTRTATEGFSVVFVACAWRKYW